MSSWIKSISNELNITFLVRARVNCDVIGGVAQSIVTSSQERKQSKWGTMSMCTCIENVFWIVIYGLKAHQVIEYALRWRHNGHDGVSNHQPHHCLLKRLFGCTSKKTSKLCVTGLCAGNSPGTGEFSAQMASNAEMFPFDDVIMG